MCQGAVPDSVDIPANCVVSDDIIDTVFPDLSCDLTTTVILTPKNDTSLALIKQSDSG